MAFLVETIELSSNIRVALIIEAGRIRPVWFEEKDKQGRDRVLIKKVCSTWSHQEGSAKVINFSVQDESNTYKLSLNTREFTWRCGVAETSSY
jgi:hypothetical protein